MTTKWIFDIGACRGEDTRHYLRRNCKVVAIEANPVLVSKLRRDLSQPIRNCDVVVVGKAVSPQSGRIRFAVTPGNDFFGTASERFVERFERTTEQPADWIEVEATTVPNLLEAYGVPYYMKVDIEGLDLACVEALSRCDEVPSFVSIESAVTSPRTSLRAVWRELSQLRAAGYTRFQFVEQAYLGLTDGQTLTGEGPPVRFEYEAEASGPFGLDLPDRWRGFGPTFGIGVVLLMRYHILGHDGRLTHSRGAKLLRRLLLKVGRLTKRVRLGGLLWYDVHAASESALARRFVEYPVSDDAPQ